MTNRYRFLSKAELLTLLGAKNDTISKLKDENENLKGSIETLSMLAYKEEK